MKIYSTALIMFISLGLVAQMPNTDLYMLTLLNNGERVTVKDPYYISGFNPDGYNNQPYFINPREVYVTTDMYDRNFTDFIKLDLQRDQYYRITATDSISEYSPTPKAPSGYFSAVRVEKDGKTQSLWLYPENHQTYGKRVLKNIGNVGYHCWLSDTEVAMFLVDTPMKLAIANIENDEVSVVLEGIGRCFRQGPDGNLLFIHKITDDSWYIKSYDPELNQASIVTQTRPGSEDFELLSDGTIIMAEGSKLYSIKPDQQEYWSEVADLAEFDILNITRLATSRNRLILVDNPKN